MIYLVKRKHMPSVVSKFLRLTEQNTPSTQNTNNSSTTQNTSSPVQSASPIRCNQAGCKMSGAKPLVQNPNALQLIMFPCPIINGKGELEMAKGRQLHYGLVLPTSLISRLTTKLNTEDNYCPVIMSSSKTASNKSKKDGRNFDNAIEVDLSKYLSGQHMPSRAIHNLLPNLICSVQPNAYVIECGTENQPGALLDQELIDDLINSVPQDKKEEAAAVKTLQDLVKLALSFNTTRQYITYYKGKDAKDYCGEGSWTHNDGPVKRYNSQEIKTLKAKHLIPRSYQEAYFARGASALNECLSTNLEDGWLTVLLIA